MKIAAFFIFSLGLLGCTTPQLSTQKDYAASRAELLQGYYKEAVDNLPKKENGGFISTVEKSYLKNLYDIAETEPLLKVAQDLERRKIIFVSQEAKEFFYMETEEGYFPAEHEVIVFHLVTGLAYAKKGDVANARVEAFKAAQYLQGHYAEHQGDFDDPGLRLWLASLWLYCDEWEHARVDLRVAAKLDPELRWAVHMAEQAHPPKNYFLVFGGVGPEPTWRPKNTTELLTGLESLRFDTDFLRSDMKIQSDKDKLALGYGENSYSWYERHQQRNTSIRDVLSGSKYMVNAGVAVTGYAAAQTANTAVTGTIIGAGTILGIVVAAPLVYLGVTAGGQSGGELIAYGLLAGWAIIKSGFKAGTNFFNDNKKENDEKLDSEVDISRRYRYARFLPDSIYAFGTNKSYKNSPQLWIDTTWNQQPRFQLKSPRGTNIYFFHVAK